ncbi:MAG: ATP-binding protein [bacterium]|nr:ATP-binding protein [bacterium]
MSESDADTPHEASTGDFERIFNPYVIGNPIRGGEPFFGREDDFAFVARRLEAERSGIVLLFAGARRSGKTSIMFQILDGRLGDEILPVFIDMQALSGIDGDAQMLGRMARSVIEGVGDERLVVDYYDFDDGNPILTFDRLLADINQIFPEKRLLLLVDEAELLRDKVSRNEISPALLTFMASALESRKVSFFFTGSPGLADADVPECQKYCPRPKESCQIPAAEPPATSPARPRARSRRTTGVS